MEVFNVLQVAVMTATVRKIIPGSPKTACT